VLVSQAGSYNSIEVGLSSSQNFICHSLSQSLPIPLLLESFWSLFDIAGQLSSSLLIPSTMNNSLLDKVNISYRCKAVR
jgi:hypothetical protein